MPGVGEKRGPRKEKRAGEWPPRPGSDGSMGSYPQRQTDRHQCGHHEHALPSHLLQGPTKPQAQQLGAPCCRALLPDTPSHGRAGAACGNKEHQGRGWKQVLSPGCNSGNVFKTQARRVAKTQQPTRRSLQGVPNLGRSQQQNQQWYRWLQSREKQIPPCPL